jgi:hypothetical protein
MSVIQTKWEVSNGYLVLDIDELELNIREVFANPIRYA